MSVKGTTRNDFNTSLVRHMVEATEKCNEWGRIMGEACCAIDGLRAELMILKRAIKDINTDPGHFE